jgi:hypothetical protein
VQDYHHFGPALLSSGAKQRRRAEVKRNADRAIAKITLELEGFSFVFIPAAGRRISRHGISASPPY